MSVSQVGLGVAQIPAAGRCYKSNSPHIQALRAQACLGFVAVPDPSSMDSKGTEVVSTSLGQLGRGRGSLGRGKPQASLGEGEETDSSRFH